ncbi:hypothetical protein B0H13DRAFT_2009250 [Mycena leptocephala]|nr:hypothetical protein B0H13DRAFT_2009250 [Mycena leptocephala]
MFKGVIKWPRKRPRDPGKPGSTVRAPGQLPKPSRNPFKLFKKLPPQLHDASHDIPSSPGDRPERRSTLALDTAALVAKTLLIASDAPVIGVLKPLTGLADLACQRFQAVCSYKDVIERLENQATQVEVMLNNIAEPGVASDPQFIEIVQVLEEIARFLDESVTRKRSKLKLWLTAPHEQDRARALSERLLFVLIRGLFQAVTALDPKRSLSCARPDEQAYDTDRTVPSSQLGKLVQRIDTTSHIAFFVYRAGVSWAPPRCGGGRPTVPDDSDGVLSSRDSGDHSADSVEQCSGSGSTIHPVGQR